MAEDDKANSGVEDDSSFREFLATGTLFTTRRLTKKQIEELRATFPNEFNFRQSREFWRRMNRLHSRYEMARSREQKLEYQDRLWTEQDRDSVMQVFRDASRLRRAIKSLTPNARRFLKLSPRSPMQDLDEVYQYLYRFSFYDRKPKDNEKDKIDEVKSQRDLGGIFPRMSPSKPSNIKNDFAVKELSEIWREISGLKPCRSTDLKHFLHFAQTARKLLDLDFADKQVEFLLKRLQGKSAASKRKK